jgi:hypothetical protein
MYELQLLSNTSFELYSEFSIPVGTSLIITNNTTSIVFVNQHEEGESSAPYPLWPAQTALVHGMEDELVWVKGSSNGKILVQELTNTITPFTAVELAQDLYTSTVEGFRRIRVDVGQTGFFEGREFRTFKDLSIPSGSTYTVKVVVNRNTILWNTSLSLESGGLKLSTVAGGSDIDPFTTSLPRIPKNRMTFAPVVEPLNTIQEGGTMAGGTVIDVVRLSTASSTTQRSSVGGSVADERGVSPGVYYFVFQNTSNSDVAGTFHMFWEERL